jgi:hypothetical protein
MLWEAERICLQSLICPRRALPARGDEEGVQFEPCHGGAAATIGAHDTGSLCRQPVSYPGHNEIYTDSDAETQRVHCKVNPSRMPTRHPDLKHLKRRHKADAGQWNKQRAGPIPDRE